MMIKIFSFFLISFFMSSSFAVATELKGYVRSINYEANSFSLDLPPLERVLINSATKVEGQLGTEAFQKSIREGDYVRVEASSSSKGLWLASELEVQKKTIEKKENEIEAKLSQNFLLEVVQTAKVEDSDFQIYFSQLVDELCAKGMDCVDQGKLTLKFIAKRGKESKAFELITQGTRKPIKPVVAELLGFKVELVEVGEYAAMLVIRKS